jgi:FKBP-type peptidyl-prolyl cis-trans isomerase FkpA
MKYVVGLLMAIAMLSACKKKTTDDGCSASPGTTVVSAAEEAMVTKYLDSMAITTAIELEGSGMYYIIDKPGNTERAKQCSVISVEYKGYYRNGQVFDQTTGTATNFGGYPLSTLYEGWKRAIPLIGEGGEIRLFIPPTMGEGVAGRFNPNTGLYDIAPNAVMIFEIKLATIN